MVRDWHKEVTMRAMHDIVAQAQVILDQESDLTAVIVVMTRIFPISDLIGGEVRCPVPYRGNGHHSHTFLDQS